MRFRWEWYKEQREKIQNVCSTFPSSCSIENLITCFHFFLDFFTASFFRHNFHSRDFKCQKAAELKNWYKFEGRSNYWIWLLLLDLSKCCWFGCFRWHLMFILKLFLQCCRFKSKVKKIQKSSFQTLMKMGKMNQFFSTSLSENLSVLWIFSWMMIYRFTMALTKWISSSSSQHN